ncbi:MAG: glycosyltransferase family 4 protein [Nitrospiraceae bacterium]|nr:glycosyltransferase family 4 protein [Nitrospiraceae bacterium]
MDRRPLTVMTLLSGEGRGGADILALDISKQLKGLGHAVIFGCPGDNALIPKALAAGLRLFILDRQGSADFASLGSFIRFCRDERVDIVNAHHSQGRHFLTAAKYLGLKSKTVFTRHCLSGGPPLLGLFLYNFAADLNIAVSRAVRRSLLAGGMLPGRVKTVYGGIDLERFDNVPQALVEDARKKYARPGVFNIGIAGRFFSAKINKPSMKRHEVLFRALAGLKEKMDFNLLALGPAGSSLEMMMEMAGFCGLDKKKITSCGFQEDPAPFYKIMDLNVLPSPREGLGLVLIEAMAAGVPSIGAAGGGIREIITDGREGFLFRPGDSAELASKIEVLLKDEGRRRTFIEAGRKKAGKLFDIEKNVKLLEDAFYGILPAD